MFFRMFGSPEGRARERVAWSLRSGDRNFNAEDDRLSGQRISEGCGRSPGDLRGVWEIPGGSPRGVGDHGGRISRAELARDERIARELRRPGLPEAAPPHRKRGRPVAVTGGAMELRQRIV